MILYLLVICFSLLIHKTCVIGSQLFALNVVISYFIKYLSLKAITVQILRNLQYPHSIEGVTVHGVNISCAHIIVIL